MNLWTDGWNSTTLVISLLPGLSDHLVILCYSVVLLFIKTRNSLYISVNIRLCWKSKIDKGWIIHWFICFESLSWLKSIHEAYYNILRLSDSDADIYYSYMLAPTWHMSMRTKNNKKLTLTESKCTQLIYIYTYYHQILDSKL